MLERRGAFDVSSRKGRTKIHPQCCFGQKYRIRILPFLHEPLTLFLETESEIGKKKTCVDALVKCRDFNNLSILSLRCR